ncbi:hypothetical protein [Deinococcus koreensis]|uniref:hypothetical protein n=1 Tax=Deinococcus koreensis TaxID=2054903 RepID=UPI0013FE167F|nr:hypothetical protein [Deinococcus koreensis]
MQRNSPVGFGHTPSSQGDRPHGWRHNDPTATVSAESRNIPVPIDAPDAVCQQAIPMYGGGMDNGALEETHIAHQQANAELIEVLAGQLRATGVALPDEHRTPQPVLEIPNEESGLAAALTP